MNKAGIEVHELQRPRPQRRKLKRRKTDLPAVTPLERAAMIGTGLLLVAFWVGVAWYFS